MAKEKIDLDRSYYEMQHCMTNMLQSIFANIPNYNNPARHIERLKQLITNSKIFDDQTKVGNPPYPKGASPHSSNLKEELARCDKLLVLVEELKKGDGRVSLKVMDSAFSKYIWEIANLNFTINLAYQAKKTGELYWG